MTAKRRALVNFSNRLEPDIEPISDDCDRCMTEHLAEDQEWVCVYGCDWETCSEEAEADRRNDLEGER